MKTFAQYMEDAWGSHQEDEEMIARIEYKLLDLGRDIEMFNARLTHGEEPVKLAMSRCQREITTLVNTFRIAVGKNKENPERGDHPPRSIDQ